MTRNFPGFPREALDFLRELKGNNNREWFLEHKGIYEKKVKGSMVEFLLALEPEIHKFAPEIDVNPAKTIFRIYRDIRFSQDKSPYKTNIAASLNPKDAKDGSGLYLHLDSEQLLIAGGLYHPSSPQLLAVRQYVAENPKKLRTIIESPEFRKQFGGLKGDRLSRVPKGFPADHPAADLLKFKDYLAYIERPAKIALTSKLFTLTIDIFHDLMPLIRFLNAGLKRAPRKSF